MSRTRIAILAFFVVSAAIQVWINREERSSRPASELEQGAAAPALSLPALDGTRVSLADFRGKYVVVDFWASWCGPCRAEFSVLSEWWKKEMELHDDVVFLAINLRESRETVKTFLDKNPLPFVVVRDEDGSVAQQFGVQSLPTLLIIDRDGKLASVSVGYDPMVGVALGARLRALMEKEKQAP